MLPQPAPKPQAQIVLPEVPALFVAAQRAYLMTPDGEIETLSCAQAREAVRGQVVLVCHAPYTRARLGADELAAYDVLELFAFARPAAFCVPTPFGLAKALDLPAPAQAEDCPFTLLDAARTLLTGLAEEPRSGAKADPLEIACAMGRSGEGWNWTPFVCEALGRPYRPEAPVFTKTAMNIWKHLPEWSETAPPPPPAHHPVSGEESRARLQSLLGPGAETRTQQMDYAEAVAAVFAPAQTAGEPHVVLAEAGTGTGKTLGYLAPASLWAEKNGGTVWVSTYTKNLQRQVFQELDRLYPDPALKEKRAAVRKGRENYLCLLNLEEAAAAAALSKSPRQAVAAGLMARWAGASGDGDLQGGDFPGWLPGLLGVSHTLGLADRRGECVYSACDHYHKCFVERAVRKSRHAAIVVANHALVMTSAVSAAAGDDLPRRYIFDEGHHLFDAADSAFAGHLTARETADLRRWILGQEGGRKSRARGLKRRAEDLIEGNVEAEGLLQDVMHAAHCLAGFGWSLRLKEARPQGSAEEFLLAVHGQVMARADGREGPYSLETGTHPLADGVAEAGRKLKERLTALRQPMKAFAALLHRKLEEQAATLDTDTRRRIESLHAGLVRRADAVIGGWIAMLDTLELPAGAQQDAAFIDWMQIERVDGAAFDLGLYRHYVDPMKPFAAVLRPAAHGIVVTSATLRDGTGDEAEDWRVARERTGADYLSESPAVFAAASPFDYAAQTRVFVVTDIDRDDTRQAAAACRVLFEAAGGGAIGLFTAVQRLRAVHRHIAGPLEEKGLRLYAQHVDGMDTGTLVDIFREDVHACLLGTDAVRDGIDVPGDSLRLLVYDRVPWPRPSILHRARRAAFGGKRYDDLIARLRLRQAYGRLVRRAGDRGVFVMLDSGLPGRLCGAFPNGVAVERLGLAETVQKVGAFFGMASEK